MISVTKVEEYIKKAGRATVSSGYYVMTADTTSP